ncbi:OHCU decarboxylase, partial [Bradyrhizobium guangdongense]|uniref:2-oxo-4-hydroxy-4-carboxy-5-ureidoimidazoline decarboxylase n=1 Tax=Bradyrhizobium guangdongense TaxID=1325090 RepID=UPI0024BFBC3B
MSQISLSDLNAASKADFVAALANVVEYSPWIAEGIFEQRPFAGINQLHAAIKGA